MELGYQLRDRILAADQNTNPHQPRQQQQHQQQMFGSLEKNDAMTGDQMLDVEGLQAKMMLIHKSRVNLSYEWRMKQLNILLRLVQENTEEIRHALNVDLGREGTEAICIETKPLEADIRYIMKHLKQWMKPEAVPSAGVMIPVTSHVERRPLNAPGVLIIAPFNYPVRLALQPLLGALAGGNPAVIKPSECTPTVALLLKRLLEKYFTEPGVVQVVLGGVSETTELLKKRWGLVMFTGSTRVGKIIQKACAETMTPTVMELGGKCPVVVDETVPASMIETVAQRIIFGKGINAGQTCVAPDTLYVHKKHVSALGEALVRQIREQFGENPKVGELARIVNVDSTKRVVALIEDAEKLGATILCGGSKICDVDTKYVCPTLILDPPREAQILGEEVFGPAMAIVPFASREEAIELVQGLPGEPLHLYVFTPSTTVFQEYSHQCTASGAFQNDVMIQGASNHLPFGGIGTSGHGNYYGKYSFLTFTHAYPVGYRPLLVPKILETLRCHPFAGIKGRLLENVAFSLPDIPVLHTRKVLFCVGTGLLLFGPPVSRTFLTNTMIFVLEKALIALRSTK
jgi:acyl-CoA reductase-like NAD-dependent aldehyde dehydrogenase